MTSEPSYAAHSAQPGAQPSSRQRPLPRSIEPMLAALGGQPFDSPSHIFEVKWDGVRALAFIEGGAVRIQDRYRRDVTALYPELQALARQSEAGTGCGGGGGGGRAGPPPPAGAAGGAGRRGGEAAGGRSAGDVPGFRYPLLPGR